MNKRKHFGMLAASVLLLLSSFAQGQTLGASHAAGQNMSDMKFAAFPGMPTCATGAVQNGDPAKGPSIILSKAASGCVIPWHWHTPNEHLMMVKGTAQLETKDGKPVKLREGGFALMPSRHVHQFRCISSCTLFIYSDAAFDIHYVDAQGKELPPEDALKAVGEKASASQ